MNALVQCHGLVSIRATIVFLRRDAGHYADALGVPPAKLSRVTARSTKELILDRVMIEAARLVRFTDMSFRQIAAATGFSDPLYFSRIFKRHRGLAPRPFRAASRGSST
jgi:AraC family transcriptional activator of pobA